MSEYLSIATKSLLAQRDALAQKAAEMDTTVRYGHTDCRGCSYHQQPGQWIGLCLDLDSLTIVGNKTSSNRLHCHEQYAASYR